MIAKHTSLEANPPQIVVRLLWTPKRAVAATTSMKQQGRGGGRMQRLAWATSKLCLEFVSSSIAVPIAAVPDTLLQQRRLNGCQARQRGGLQVVVFHIRRTGASQSRYRAQPGPSVRVR